MSEYVFTSRGYEILLEMIKKNESILEQSTRTKSEAGQGQDDWHDEQFQRAMVEEEMWQKRLLGLKKILSQAQIIEPEEQNEFVDIGTGVVIQHEDGSIFKFIMQGCVLEIDEEMNFVSVHSPLGQAILGSKAGETKSFRVEDKEKKITVQKIFPPSEAEILFKK